MKRFIAIAAAAALYLTPISPAFAAFGLSFITGSSNSNNTGSVSSIQSSSNITVAAGTPMLFAGDIVSMHASSDLAVLTDAGSNTWHTYQCPQTVGSLNIGWISWTPNTNGITAGKVTLTDNGGTVGSSGALYLIGFTLTGFTSLSEDTLIRACNGQTGATTTPTLTTGAPAGSNEFLITNYFSPNNSSGFTYTLDSGHGWAAGSGVDGTSRQMNIQDKQTNAGSSAVVNSPTTSSFGYSFMSVGFCDNGCASSGVTNHNLSSAGAGQ